MTGTFDIAEASRFGEASVRHDLMRDAANMADASPAALLLKSVQTIHKVLLSADPRSLKRSIGWFGRLLGRDIALQAESEALRSHLRVDILEAHRLLHDLQLHDKRLQQLRDDFGQAIKQLDADVAALNSQVMDSTDVGLSTVIAQRTQFLASLAYSYRMTGAHLDLTVTNHRELARRVALMLPRVELLLDQDRLLRAGHTENTAIQSAAQSMDGLVDLIDPPGELPSIQTTRT